MGKICGLLRLYKNDGGYHSILRRLMCLYPLPKEIIEPQFYKLRGGLLPEPVPTPADVNDNANPSIWALLVQFFYYVERAWIKNSKCPPAVWSAFMMYIRTNSGQEGWCNKLKCFSGINCNFYRLLFMLHKEACSLPFDIAAICSDLLVTYQRTSTQRTNKCWRSCGTIWITITWLLMTF